MSQRSKSYSVGIVTVSDSCSSGTREDISGASVASLVSDPEIFPATQATVYREKVPDDKKVIMDTLTKLADVLMLDLVITVGGTGFSPRDVTPEATEEVCNRKAQSLAFAMTASCFKDSPFSLLSRATCGIRNKTIILNLPGSVKGSTECFLKVSKIISHAIDQVKNDLCAVEKTHSEVSLATACEPSAVKTVSVALRSRISPHPMIPSDQALEIILSHTSTLGTEVKRAYEFVGHVAALDITANIPSPPFRASVKDGYAVLVSDGMKPRRVLSASVAGDSPENIALVPGGCVRVNTGAPIPAAADAVVQVEDTVVSRTTEEGEEIEIEIKKAPEPSLDIREIGSDVPEGQIIVPKGKGITTFDCGVLAAAGVEAVTVYAYPSVALLSTGDELVPSKGDLRSGTIIDSSKPVLSVMLKEMNVPYYDMGIAKDNPDEIKKHLKFAFEKADIIVVTGGVSMGEKDFTKDVLVTDFSADIHFHRVNIKPGKPTAFATVVYGGKMKRVFCLPGNPVSTLVTFQIFVVPCLRKIMGHREITQLTIKAVLAEDVDLDPRPEYHRVAITWSKDGPIAHSTGSQMSSRLLSFCDASGLMVLPQRTVELPKLHKGCEIEVKLINYFAS